MALYVSPNTMISDERLLPAQREKLEEQYMPKIDHKSQLIADLNFLRTIQKKKVEHFAEVMTMTQHTRLNSHRLLDDLAKETITKTYDCYREALDEVKRLTGKISLITSELNDVVKEMYERYKYYLSARPDRGVRKKETPKSKTEKTCGCQNCFKMSRNELKKLINELSDALLNSDPNEDDFRLILVDKAHRN